MKKLLFYTMVVLLFTTSFSCPAQIITTIAGNGEFGNSMDGILAINDPLNYLNSIRTDNAGNIYITDGTNQIRKIDAATGIINTVAGNGTGAFSGDEGPAADASLYNPSAFVINKQGDFFICDTWNNRIRKIDGQTHIIKTFAGNGTINYIDNNLAINTGLPQPSSIDLDSMGNIYIGVSDFTGYGGTNYIFKVDAGTGIITKIAGNGTGAYAGSGSIALQTGFYVTGLRVNVSGDVFFADPVHNCILKLTVSTGVITTIAGTGKVNGFAYTGDGGLAINAQLNTPVDITFDANNNLLIAEEGNSVIRKIDLSTGIISTVAGNGIEAYFGDSGLATCSSLHITNGAAISQSGITTDKAGNFLFCDQSNQRIRKVDHSSYIPVNPSLTISTPFTNICSGQTISIKAHVSAIGYTPTNFVFNWVKNGITVGGDSAIYITNTLKNNDTLFCAVQTTTNACKPVTVKSNSIIFHINSSFMPKVSITASDTVICQGKAVTFKASVINPDSISTYQWQLNGSNVGYNNSNYTNDKLNEGDIIKCIITVNSRGCPVTQNIASNAITMFIKLVPDVALLPGDTTISAGNKVQLTAVVAGDLFSYNWNPSEWLNSASVLNPIASPLNTTKYVFTAVNSNGCTVQKSILIHVSISLFMPNAFTPNGDGRNDIVRIPAGTSIKLKEFAIYNRWGEKIFSTNNITYGWNGYFNGQLQPEGIYIYVIRGFTQYQPVNLLGTVILIR